MERSIHNVYVHTHTKLESQPHPQASYIMWDLWPPWYRIAPSEVHGFSGHISTSLMRESLGTRLYSRETHTNTYTYTFTATTHLQIHLDTADIQDTDINHICTKIQTTIFSVLQNVFERMHFTDIEVKPAFLCSCSPTSEDHAAIVCHMPTSSYLVCSRTSKSQGQLEWKQRVWFEECDMEQKGIVLSLSTISLSIRLPNILKKKHLIKGLLFFSFFSRWNVCKFCTYPIITQWWKQICT